MQKYGLNELRNMFLDFFETKEHLKMESFSLIPHNDKSLLIINSGMAPLKPYFTGQEKPPRNRVTTCQKCIRTPDIENVGKTARHGTFFEMLGNFSFGNYFKHEAIAWAWEFMTEVVKIPKDLLYVTVYEDDDEASEIWNKEIGLDKKRIVRMGKDDNFWEIGLGPCGPCSEIYVDRGEKFGCGDPNCYVGCECDRYCEVWNLVFTQFDRDEEGNYSKLAHPNIDTGMGLERLAAVCQDVDNLFEVDTVRYILDYVCSISNTDYGKNADKDVSIRVITDHIRSVVFMLSDGIIPSNEGRGYVLRRLLRRAVRHGKLLGIEENFMVGVAQKVIETSSGAYDGLRDNKDNILKTISIEEIRFNETISQGMELMKAVVSKVKLTNKNIVDGEDAFKLYDTFGFPFELTVELAEEEGLSVDTEGYKNAMQKQKETSAAAHSRQGIDGWKDELGEIVASMPPTIFTGYDNLVDTAKVNCIVKDGQKVDSCSGECVLLFEHTPFYAKSGGQLGDKGTFSCGGMAGQITDTLKHGDKFTHFANVTEGEIKLGDEVCLKVDSVNRLATERNHTSTHLLHKALKMVLGTHVNQSGSEVSADRLRFDFSHYEKVTDEEIKQVEKIVNDEIIKCTDVVWFEKDKSEAKEIGATALFGEKYGDRVRIVQVGDFSMELCGGCHLKNTGHAGMFKILSESGVAAGVRRIEAVTGISAYNHMLEVEAMLNNAAKTAKSSTSQLTNRIVDLQSQINALQKEINEMKNNQNKEAANDLTSKIFEVNSIKCIFEVVDGLDANELRNLCDKLREKLVSGVVFLASANEEKGFLICGATKDVVSNGFNAGAFVKKVAQSVGSGGGGKPDMAQAGLKDISRKEEAITNARTMINDCF